MSFWKQIPSTTKVYLIILAYLSMMLFILVIMRLTMTSMDKFSLKHLFDRQGASRTATSISELSLTATYEAMSIYAPGTPWLRTTSDVKIFMGPSYEYNNIALLESGQKAEVVGISPDRQWWAIKIPYIESGRGWVPADQVVVENGNEVSILVIGEATPTGQKPSDEVPMVRAFSNVNIRSGPDLIFEKIGLLRIGEKAEVIGLSQDGFWWSIKLPGKDDAQGWVAKDYVIPTNTDDVPIVKSGGLVLDKIPPTPSPGAPSLTAIYTVNVRAGPGREYAVVAQLEQSQTAEVVGVSTDGLWIALKLPSQKNGRGWVAAAYVKLANASNVPILK